MNELEKLISSMDAEYFAKSSHKIAPELFFRQEDIVLLDIRAKEETESIKLVLKHHCPVLEIPVNEVPARLNEIPGDKKIGVFCSGGIRAVIIYTYLLSKGYKEVKALSGGYEAMFAALQLKVILGHISKK
jgi:rhodanese-related sulfurtransferase